MSRERRSKTQQPGWPAAQGPGLNGRPQSTLWVGQSSLSVSVGSARTQIQSIHTREACTRTRTRAHTHTCCLPHTAHPQSCCYQFCSLSSCTNNDTSSAQVSSCLKMLSGHLSARSMGAGQPQEPPLPSSPVLTCPGSTGCSEQVFPGTLGLCRVPGQLHRHIPQDSPPHPAPASGHSPYCPDHGRACLSHNQGLAGCLSSTVPWCVSQGPEAVMSQAPLHNHGGKFRKNCGSLRA